MSLESLCLQYIRLCDCRMELQEAKKIAEEKRREKQEDRLAKYAEPD